MQLAGRKQIEDRTDRSGGRDLNGAQYPAVHFAAVDLVRVGLLNEMAFLVAADCDKDDHHILECCRYRVLQDIFQHIPAIAQAQIVEKGAYDRRMARIANRAVIESADLPFEDIAKGPDAARSVERLVGNAIERKFLPLLQRRHLAAHAIHDRFASRSYGEVCHHMRTPRTTRTALM